MATAKHQWLLELPILLCASDHPIATYLRRQAFHSLAAIVLALSNLRGSTPAGSRTRHTGVVNSGLGIIHTSLLESLAAFAGDDEGMLYRQEPQTAWRERYGPRKC